MITTLSRQWMERILGFVYPDVCQVCRDQPASACDGYVCDVCRRQLTPVTPPFCHRCGLPFPGELTSEFQCSNCQALPLHFEQARAAVLARGAVLEVIHRYKYHRATWFEPFLAALLVDRAAPELRSREWDLILPVPLHPTRQREREFNQAARLAHHLGTATGIPVQLNVLARVRPTPTQTRLGRGERLRNMLTAFRAGDRFPVKDKSIVLVDDVFTTGATTSACARVLKAAGAAKVCVWTVARGI